LQKGTTPKNERKKRVCFCVAILFSSVKLELLTGFFQFFFLSFKQMAFFKQQMAFFLATNGFF